MTNGVPEPRCGSVTSEAVPEVLTSLGATIGTVWGVVGGVTGVFGGMELGSGMSLTILSITFTVPVWGVMTGVLTVVAVLGLIAAFVIDRCREAEGNTECVAGAVHEVIQSFSETYEYIFPFAAMHDRVDLVVKSYFWPVVESGGAHVHCTDTERPRRSEIMRTYFYSRDVCAAGAGSLAGAAVGGFLGIIVGAAIAAAIGCTIIIICALLLILVALVVAIMALAGAMAGGHIARNTVGESTPRSEEGDIISIGDYLTTRGTMVRRDEDDGANVFWWVDEAILHGEASDTLTRPFFHRDIEAEFTLDACERDIY